MSNQTLSIDEIIGIARRAKSLMHRNELAWLIELAGMAPDGIGVEIGVYCGASLIAWSLMRQGRGQVVGIDNWSYQDEYVDQFVVKGNEHNNIRIDGLKGVCEANLTTAGILPQVWLIDSDSVDAARVVQDDLAFVFIDGNHTSPAIDNDVAAWMPKIRRGGIAAFHDYGRRKNGCRVTQAVDNWQAREPWEFIGLVDTTAGYRKP